MGGFYPFGGTTSLPSNVPNQSLGDVQIYENNPGLQLAGTEASAAWAEFREVAGAIWIVQNARWNGTGWTQINGANSSYALKIDATGNTLFLSCAAATPSITWTQYGEISNTGVLSGLTLGSGILAGLVLTTTNQTIAGVKTFSSPPVMSGASVQTGTLPLSALTSSVVVSVTGSGNIASSGGTTPNITLAAAPTISGANITAATVPNAALVTTPVTAVTASGNIASSGGTTPAISFTGILPVANGGTNTATPGLVGGTNVTITGTWPNQTVTASGSTGVSSVTGSGNIASSGGANPNITLTGQVPVANGGTGTASPAIVAGTNVTVSGTWPNQTVNSVGPPVYTLAGGATTGMRIMTGTVSVSVANGTTSGVTTTTISSNAFTSSTSYYVTATLNNGSSFLNGISQTNIFTSVTQLSGAQFNINVNTTATSTGSTVVFNVHIVGN